MRIYDLTGQDILATQHLTRWHMVRTRRAQTLAEHLGTVAMLSVKIAALWDTVTLSLDDMANLLDYALTHDAHEIEFGDPPSPAVRIFPEAHAAAITHFWKRRGGLSPVAPHIERIVAIADKLEAALFYQLEGEDPGLKAACWQKVRELVSSAPLPVALWASQLMKSVEIGTFTPQPGGAGDDHQPRQPVA